MELRAGISLAAIEQWGYLQQQAEKWIYPIPVLEAFIATKTCISNNHSAAGYVGYWTWDKDITTEYAYSWNNYPSYCFMIGKVQQQWGFTNNTGRPYITFPFKFSNVFTAISCICHNGSPSEANTVYNVSISGMNIGASGGGSGKYWCAFGVAQQQWGIISNNKAIFPLVFNVFVSSALLLSRGSGTGTWYGDSSNTTLTGISCVTPDYVLSGTYIAIGA